MFYTNETYNGGMIMKYTFTPSGVCSVKIEFDLDNGTVSNVKFTRGCSGNTQGVGALCEGRKADEVVKCLEGIKCGAKGTSCPDQLAKAIKMAMAEEK